MTTEAKTTKQVLIEARALIENETDWGRGKLEDKPNGRLCAVGAILTAKHGSRYLQMDSSKVLDWDLEKAFLRPLAEVLPYAEVTNFESGWRVVCHITAFNDTMPHHCVIAAFDAAIEAIS